MSREKPLPHVTETTRPYWEGARLGKLMLQRCRRCRTAIHYPRPWCSACWSTDLDWVEAAGRGRVVTFTVVHQPPFEAYAGDVPYVLAVVKLDEGPQMMANVLGIEPAAMRVDLPVRVVFERRSGGFCVPQFEPARD
ncbi:MAG: Zn-ribbon domain-containing OB-fold protein [Deltaproteobacteria bacterium]|nr:Zn-ribbon domain-containing OB-fold protein [Deltaproteobacteria bacterium]